LCIASALLSLFSIFHLNLPKKVTGFLLASTYWWARCLYCLGERHVPDYSKCPPVKSQAYRRGEHNLQKYLCQWSCFDLVWVFRNHMCRVGLCHSTSAIMKISCTKMCKCFRGSFCALKIFLTFFLGFRPLTPASRCLLNLPGKEFQEKMVLVIFCGFIPADLWGPKRLAVSL